MSESLSSPEHAGPELDPAQAQIGAARLAEVTATELSQTEVAQAGQESQEVAIIPDERALAIRHSTMDVRTSADMERGSAGRDLARIGFNALATYVRNRLPQTVGPALDGPRLPVRREESHHPVEVLGQNAEPTLQIAMMVRSYRRASRELPPPPPRPSVDPSLHPSGLTHEAWNKAQAEHDKMMKEAALKRISTNQTIREAQEAVRIKQMKAEQQEREGRTRQTVMAHESRAKSKPVPSRNLWERHVTDTGKARMKKYQAKLDEKAKKS